MEKDRLGEDQSEPNANPVCNKKKKKESPVARKAL